MSELGWFAAFALIFLLMVGISSWMMWFSRRTMKSQKEQMEDIIREMRQVIDDEKGDEAPERSEETE